MSYKNEVKIHRDALKFIQGLDWKRKARVKEVIENLKFFPLIRQDVAKVKGFPNAFRIRVGNIRIWFEYDKHSKAIFIRKVSFRGGFYK